MAEKPEKLNPPEPPGKIHPGVKLDVLRKIADELDADPELQSIFGSPVSSKIAFIDKEGVFRIIEAGEIPLDNRQKEIFVSKLNVIIGKYRRK